LVGEVEPERRAHVQHHGAYRKRAYPELRSLHVGQYPDRASQFLLHLANLGEPLAVLFMRTVAEVEAKHIDAGQEERTNHLRAGAGRPEGGDDLGVASASHRHGVLASAAISTALKSFTL